MESTRRICDRWYTKSARQGGIRIGQLKKWVVTDRSGIIEALQFRLFFEGFDGTKQDRSRSAAG